MTVQELIEELQKVEDKTQPILHWNDRGQHGVSEIDDVRPYEQDIPCHSTCKGRCVPKGVVVG